jgi:hypothetical protein
MLVGTRHYVSRTVLDVPDERAIGSSTSRFGSPPTRQHASHLLRGRNCRTQRVVPDASWERALVEPIAIQKLNCDPHVAGGVAHTCWQPQAELTACGLPASTVRVLVPSVVRRDSPLESCRSVKPHRPEPLRRLRLDSTGHDDRRRSRRNPRPSRCMPVDVDEPAQFVGHSSVALRPVDRNEPMTLERWPAASGIYRWPA